jgi:TolB protein
MARLVLVAAMCLLAAACSSGSLPGGLLGSDTTENAEGTGDTDSAGDTEGAGQADSADDSSGGQSGSEAEPEPEAGSGSSADQGSADTPDEPRPPPTLSDDQLTERLSELTGRLAVGLGPELAVARPDGTRFDVIDGSETVLAAQPTWSRDGSQLAWSSVSAERQVVLIQPFDDEGVRSGPPTVSDAAGTPIFYLQWNEADQRLAYIRNSAGGGSVEVGLVEPGRPVVPVGDGAPFYVSWSPAPDRLLAHVNESSIERYEPGQTTADEADEPQFVPVVDVVGGFSAPAWLDDRRALIVDDDRLLALDVAQGSIEPIIDLAGPVRFVLSPDRTRVAYQNLGGSGGPQVVTNRRQPVQADGPGLVVLDLETMEQVAVSDRLAGAWEWSPDGETLAWLEVQLVGQRPAGRWNFWSGDEPPPTQLSEWFLFTRKYGQSYLPFFAQYAQSVTGWSPDSTAFAFAGAIGSERGVWIQLIDEVVAPRNVTVGDYVTWGPGQPPPPSPGASAA